MANTVSPDMVGLSASQLKHLDAVLQQYIDQGQLSGIVALLAHKGHIAHAASFGYQNLTTREPVQMDSLFRIFSMTKPITSLSILMLWEQGYLDMHAPVETYIPGFKHVKALVNQTDKDSAVEPLARSITIHDLLTHTSGLGYGLDANLPVDALYVQDEMLRMDEPLADKIARVVTRPLHHQPGLRYTYSIATDVLGYLVELVSGSTLDSFFSEHIFSPLGMLDTAFYVSPDELGRLATLYTPDPSGKLMDVCAVPREDRPQFLRDQWVDKSTKPHFLSGGGGLVSTAADYMRFAMMLANKGSLDGMTLVQPETIELMTTPHLTPEQFLVPGCSSGYGLTVVMDPTLAQIPASTGAYGGGGAANTDFWVDPSRKLIGVLMTQYVAFTPSTVAMAFKQLAAEAIMD